MTGSLAVLVPLGAVGSHWIGWVMAPVIVLLAVLYTLWLCLGILAAITLANLRGTPEAGLLFALPTYIFIASFAGIVAMGAFRIVAAQGHPHPVIAPPRRNRANFLHGSLNLERI